MNFEWAREHIAASVPDINTEADVRALVGLLLTNSGWPVYDLRRVRHERDNIDIELVGPNEMTVGIIELKKRDKPCWGASSDPVSGLLRGCVAKDDAPRDGVGQLSSYCMVRLDPAKKKKLSANALAVLTTGEVWAYGSATDLAKSRREADRAHPGKDRAVDFQAKVGKVTDRDFMAGLERALIGVRSALSMTP